MVTTTHPTEAEWRKNLSLAGDSVGEILQAMGIAQIGAPGTTAAPALLNAAVKKGGLFASSSVGGLSGAFIPVCEDVALAAAAGHLSLEKLEAMTSVCSVGLDMIALPGATDAGTLAAISADEMARASCSRCANAARRARLSGAARGFPHRCSR